MSVHTIQYLIPGRTTNVELLKQVKNWQSPSRDPWSNCLINSQETTEGQTNYYSGRQKDNSKTICGFPGYHFVSFSPLFDVSSLSFFSQLSAPSSWLSCFSVMSLSFHNSLSPLSSWLCLSHLPRLSSLFLFNFLWACACTGDGDVRVLVLVLWCVWVVRYTVSSRVCVLDYHRCVAGCVLVEW